MRRTIDGLFFKCVKAVIGFFAGELWKQNKQRKTRSSKMIHRAVNVPFHVKLNAFVAKLRTLLSKFDATEIKLNVIQVEKSFL